MPVLSVDVSLSSETSSAGPLRQVARLAGSVLRRPVDSELMALLTTELVSNAVRLEAGPVRVTFRTTREDRVRVEVHDRSRARPRPRRPGPLDDGGARGLLIVSELADAWGVDDAPGGKAVWFELATHRAAERPAPNPGTVRAGPLHEALDDAFDRSDEAALERLASEPSAGRPDDERDDLLTILSLTDLHLAPINELGSRVCFQHHPGIATLKVGTEQRFLGRLDTGIGAEPPIPDAAAAVARVRAIAAEDAVPSVYEWIEDRADPASLRAFLALEGGPDGGFDDLVAVGQVGLTGDPKLEMARNYWDEMGRGEAAEVHTVLHRRMAEAAGLAIPPRRDQPTAALARTALGAVLATNRALQPELIGALGLLELQAGPRCRRVLAGLRRCGADPDTLPFYEEHAVTDPRHGKDWLDRVIAPLSSDEGWARGIVRGARWRAAVNRRFFDDLARRFAVGRPGPPLP